MTVSLLRIPLYLLTGFLGCNSIFERFNFAL